MRTWTTLVLIVGMASAICANAYYDAAVTTLIVDQSQVADLVLAQDGGYYYDGGASCHLYHSTDDEGNEETYCMAIELVETMTVGGVQQIYVVTKGDSVIAYDGEYHENGCHACNGVNGFFVYRYDGVEYRLVSRLHEKLGSWGKSPDGWELIKVAPNIWGFLAEHGYANQGYSSSEFLLVTPTGDDLALSSVGQSDSNGGSGDRYKYGLEAEFVVDTTQLLNGYYPLLFTVNGNDERKRYKNAVFTATHQPHKGYVVPKNYPLTR